MITVEEVIQGAYMAGELERLALIKSGIKEVIKQISINNIKIRPADVNLFLRAKGYDSGWRNYLTEVCAEFYDNGYVKKTKTLVQPERRKYGACLDRVQRNPRSKPRRISGD